MVLLGDFLKLEVVWIIDAVVNRLMGLPNLVALIALSSIVVLVTKKYFAHLKENESSKKIS